MFIKWNDQTLNIMTILKMVEKELEKWRKQATHPTIYKVFTGINYAIANYKHWKENSSEITAIVISFLLPKV